MGIIKNVIVTFEFDPEMETVSNVQCSVDGVEKVKKSTRKKSDVVAELESQALITLEENKLVFNNKTVADMEIEYKDRIVIKWEKIDKDSKKLFPIIGKDLAFDEEGSGNSVTKSNTISYRGTQNTILKELGDTFTIEPYKENIWKLVSTTNPDNVRTLEETIKVVEKVPAMLIIEGEDDEPIDELQFTLK